MKNNLLKSALTICIGILLSTSNVSAQCSGGSLIANLTPTTTYQVRNSTLAGQYFTFTAQAGVTYEWTYCNGGGSGFADMQITILDNTGAYAGGYNDDFCGLSSHVVWVAQTSAVYRVLISQFFCNNSGANMGNMAYRINTPSNDLCASPIGVGMPSATVGNTTYATVDATPFGGSSNGVWYSIVGNGNQFTFNTCGGVTNYDTYLAIYTGTCSGLTGVTVNDDACGLQSSVTWCTTNGTTYLIHVYGFSTSNGSFTLTGSQVVIPTPTITPASATICSGNSTTLVASGSTTYTWNPGALSGASQTLSPASTTTYTITGTTSGCSRTATAVVTVNPTPTVTTTTTGGTICSGNSTSITASGATTYSWMPGSLTGTTVTVSPTSTTTYTVTGTSAGCSSTATRTITVNPLPTVIANTTATAVCAGGSVTLTGSGATSYTWDNSVVDGVSFVPTATTMYMVTGTDGNGCTDMDMITITVNALPTVIANTTAAAVCAGGSVTLTGSGATSYTWDNSVVDGVSFVPTATTTYMVTGTDGNGCMDTDMTTVTVNALPTVIANTTATAVCAGGSVTLTGSGATSYTWDNSVTDGVSFVPTATTTYMVTGTDGNGCTDTDMLTVTVNALPTVTANSTAAAVCAGGSVTLTGGGATSYTWDNSVTDGVSFVPTATTTYMVTGTDANGCVNTATTTVTVNALPVVVLGADVVQCGGTVMFDAGNVGSTYLWSDASTAQTITLSATATVYVDVTDVNGCMGSDTAMATINALPTVALGADTTNCGSVTLDAGNVGSTYLWSDASTTQTITVSATDTVYVDVTDANGCMSSDTIIVTVNTPPTVTGTAASSVVCVDDASVVLTGSPVGGTWSGPGVTGSSFSPSAAGVGAQTATYTFTDVNGCTGTADANIQVNACVSVVETSLSNGVNVFPNPNSGSFTLAVNANVGDMVIEMVDMQGRVVYSSIENNVQAGYNKQISMENVANGVYMLRMTTANEQNIVKISVQK